MVTTRPRSYRDTTARRLVPQLSAENLCNCTEESVQRASTETLNLLSALLFEIRGCKRPRGIVDCDIFFFFEGKVFDLSFRFLFYSLLFYYKVFSFFIVRSIGLFNGYFLLYLLLFQNSFYYLN